jgi:hypothetical protein
VTRFTSDSGLVSAATARGFAAAEQLYSGLVSGDTLYFR